MLIRPVIYDPIRSVMRDPLGASIGFYVGQLFANGEQGVWYDPSDFSTLFQDAAGTIPVTAVEQPVGRILDKSGRGNHATQATAAARPVLSARKNLLLKTEQLTDAVWVKTAATVVLDAITESVTNAQHHASQTVIGVATVGGMFTATADFRQGSGTRNFVLRVSGASGSAYAVFNPSTGALVTSAITGANWSHTTPPVAAVPTDDGWFTATVSVTTNETGNVINMLQLASGTTLTYLGDGTSSVRARKAQLERGSTATRYQRVNTATDYDSAGFPHYLKFDGVDDFLVTGNINFTATDKMTVWVGVTKLSDVNAGSIAELSATPTATPGAFAVTGPEGAGVGEYRARLRGSLASGSVQMLVAAPNTSVITSIMDLAVPRIDCRRNGLAAGSNSSAMGVGLFSSNPMYIGRRGGTSMPLNGQLNQLIVRGAASTNTQIEYGEDYTASKTGVTLP